MKRFMYLSIGVLCLSLSVLIGFHLGHQGAQAGQKTVTAQKFVLVDPDGNERGEWVADDGSDVEQASENEAEEPPKDEVTVPMVATPPVCAGPV